MFKFKFGGKKNNTDKENAASVQNIEEVIKDPAAYAESVTPVPSVELIPPAWNRQRIISMVRMDEMTQSVKVIGCIFGIVVIAASICLCLWMWNGISQRNLEQQDRHISDLMDQYDKSISRAAGMNGILQYTQELSLAEQARSLVNICVTSGIVVHKLDMTHDSDLIPANVRNSFETTTSLKIEDVHLHGIWIVDGSFTKNTGHGTNEQWILATNKTFATMFQGTRFNTFLDISTRAVRSQDGVNRHEFVFMFWSPAETKEGAAR